MDLIKREDAVKGKQAQTLNANAEFMMGRLCNEDESRIYSIGFAEGWNAHIERCKDIPSAEKQGEWIDHDSKVAILGLRWKCSCCGIVASDRTRFCPNCGARMKGADDE